MEILTKMMNSSSAIQIQVVSMILYEINNNDLYVNKLHFFIILIWSI